MINLDVNKIDGNPPSTKPTSIFGVFDGHGGKEVALFCAAHLPQALVISDGYQQGDLRAALEQTYLQMDELMTRQENKEELKALKGGDEDDGARGAGKHAGESMMIDSSQLPNSLLEALGVPEDSGYVFKVVKSPDGLRIDGIEGGEEEEEEDAGMASAVEGTKNEGKRAPAITRTTTKLINTGNSSNDTFNTKRKKTSSTGDDDDDDDQEDNDGTMSRGGPFSNASKRQEGGSDGGEDDAEDIADAAAAAAEGHPGEIVLEEFTSPGVDDEDEWYGPSAGCTAVCAVVRDGTLYVANAGDSRCVLSNNGQAVAMSHDHKPTDTEEYARITKAGGFVADGRVNGSLNLSRALGDLEYKTNHDLGPEEQMVTALPEVRCVQLEEGHEFLILACDGIWDVLSNQEAVDFARERLLDGRTAKEVCEDICDHCLAPDTGGCGKGCDNMSVVLAVLMDSEFGKKIKSKRK